MLLGNPVGAAYLQSRNHVALQKLVTGFCADAQQLAHRVDIHDIRVIFQVNSIGLIVILTQGSFSFLLCDG